MERDLIFYQFSRSKVEQVRLQPFPEPVCARQAARRQCVTEMMNCFVFCVEGWDDDPREIHLIPEIRKFYSTFHDA